MNIEQERTGTTVTLTLNGRLDTVNAPLLAGRHNGTDDRF